jgi:hypothetical protein
MNTIIGSEQNNDSDQPTINGGQYNTIIGSKGGVSTSSNYQLITNSTSSQIQGGEHNALIGGNNNQIGNGSYYNLVAASESVTHGTFAGGGYKMVTLASGNGNLEQATETFIAATRNFSSHLQGSNTMSMIASKSPTIEPVTNSAEVMSILNSKSSTLRPNQHNSIIINSDSVSIDDSNSSQTQISAIINGWGGGINGAGIGGNYQKMLINTYGTEITHGGSRVVALNANGGTISATGDHNMLINTESKDITGSRNKATVIGVWDNTQPVDYENTVYVGALHNYGPRSGRVINAGNVSGIVDVDGSLGEMFEFTLTGNTAPNFINLREGQKFLFAIYNTTFSVTGGTINGVGGNVLAKGGSISPSNNSWSFYTGWYDGTRVYLIEENGLSSI